MFNSVYIVFTFTYLFKSSFCHVIWDKTNELQPVHGLYVKPSIDGTTGDLYVAASEDNGIKSQWLTDQPVNFLPTSSQNQQQPVPVQFSSTITKTSSPNEESVTSQRRTVVTNPSVRYPYPLPVQATDGNYIPAYPYPLPGSPSAEGSNVPYCTDSSIHPYPFQYFYPPMMSAMANAMNIMKESNTREGSQFPSPLMPPYWPHSYGYPYQYVMVDPNSWAQSQGTNPPNSTTATSSENS